MQVNNNNKKGSNNYIRQNSLQDKGHNKRQRKSLHNTKGGSQTRRYNPCKHRCTQIYKDNLGGL